MINLWYNSDEVTGFHPVVESAINNAIVNCGYDSVMELVHHPAIQIAQLYLTLQLS